MYSMPNQTLAVITLKKGITTKGGYLEKGSPLLPSGKFQHKTTGEIFYAIWDDEVHDADLISEKDCIFQEMTHNQYLKVFQAFIGNEYQVLGFSD